MAITPMTWWLALFLLLGLALCWVAVAVLAVLAASRLAARPVSHLGPPPLQPTVCRRTPADPLPVAIARRKPS
jgi:hypothetical protein